MQIAVHDTGIHTRVRISRSENLKLTDKHTYIICYVQEAIHECIYLRTILWSIDFYVALL
jgi:hypothetical protein